MAELTKKLHFKKNGTEQTAKAYSTVDEAGDNYVPLKIDGVACYAPLGATTDAMATNGRVIKGGTTYAIKSQSKPPYAEISYTTAGTYTFTVPAGITRLRVAVCGGGGGGATALAYYGDTMSATGGNGGASSFGSLVNASGGGGGYAGVYADEYERVPVYYGKAGEAGSPNGHAGIRIDNYGTNYPNNRWGRSVSFTDTASATSTSYGSGGGATQNDRDNAWQQACTGGSGGYSSTYVNVSPNTTISVVVGAGGALKDNNSAGEAKSGAGGFVLIAYGGDI